MTTRPYLVDTMPGPILVACPCGASAWRLCGQVTTDGAMGYTGTCSGGHTRHVVLQVVPVAGSDTIVQLAVVVVKDDPAEGVTP